MPSYFVNNGLKQEIDDLFDLLWNSIDRPEQTDSETSSSTTSSKRNSDWRKQEDGYYNSKPNDEEYF